MCGAHADVVHNAHKVSDEEWDCLKEKHTLKLREPHHHIQAGRHE
jgi:hypothetical protein